MNRIYHNITPTLMLLAARPGGVSTNELIEATGKLSKPIRAAIWKCKKREVIFSKGGLNAAGVFINRNFTTRAAADAYVFAKVPHAMAHERRQKTLALILGAIDVPRTCRQISVKIGRGVEGAYKSVLQLTNEGLVFKARTRCSETKRVIDIIFSTRPARDAWQAANPVPPIIRIDKRVRTPRTRKPEKVRKSARSALSAVGRRDTAVAEMLNRRSVKAFETTPKPREYVLTDADKLKIQRCDSSAGLGNRYYVAPDEVPLAFASLRPGQYLELTV